MRRAWIVLLAAAAGCAAGPGRAPDTVSAYEYVERGVALLREGRLADADAAFGVAVGAAPVAEALDGLGVVRLRLGRTEEAGVLFERALAAEPGYARAYSHLAAVRLAAGDRTGAREAFERAAGADPTDAEVRNDYAVFLAEEGDRAGAERLLREASVISRHPIVTRNLTILASSDRTSGPGTSRSVLEPGPGPGGAPRRPARASRRRSGAGAGRPDGRLRSPDS